MGAAQPDGGDRAGGVGAGRAGRHRRRARRADPGQRRLHDANRKLAIANERVTQANTDLKSANEREKQRFNLAMDAIKLFHGEVSEDLLLKEKQFESLRTKLLNGAADFYGRLEDLLKGQADRESPRRTGQGV